MDWCLTGSSVWVSARHPGLLPQQSAKWLEDYEIGCGKDQVMEIKHYKSLNWIGLQYDNQMSFISENIDSQ